MRLLKDKELTKIATKLWRRQSKDYKHLNELVPQEKELDEITHAFFSWKNQIVNLTYLINRISKDPPIKQKFKERLDDLIQMFIIRYNFFYKKGKVIKLPPKWINEFYKSLN